MKRSIRFSLLCAGVCALLPVTGLFAQDTAAPAAPAAPAATPSVAVPPAGTAPAVEPGHKHGGKGAGKGEGHMKAAMAALTPDERHQLRLARDKAMADPAVKEAQANKAADRKGARQALQAAMLKADPTIQPILDKVREAGGKRMKKKDLQTN